MLVLLEEADPTKRQLVALMSWKSKVVANAGGVVDWLTRVGKVEVWWYIGKVDGGGWMIDELSLIF